MARKTPRKPAKEATERSADAEDALAPSEDTSEESDATEATEPEAAPAAGPARPALDASDHVAAVLAAAGVPAQDHGHPKGAILARAWDFYLAGDYVEARRTAAPLREPGADIPASYLKAAEALGSVMGLETVSLAIGGGLVALFLIILAILY